MCSSARDPDYRACPTVAPAPRSGRLTVDYILRDDRLEKRNFIDQSSLITNRLFDQRIYRKKSWPLASTELISVGRGEVSARAAHPFLQRNINERRWNDYARFRTLVVYLSLMFVESSPAAGHVAALLTTLFSTVSSKKKITCYLIR